MGDPVNLQAKLSAFTEHWAPRVVTALNDYEVMVVKVEGEFVWHSHAETDDFFFVLKGVLEIDLREDPVKSGETGMRERTVTLRPGELFVVPKGVEHRPAARQGEVEMLLIEPKGTPNTGNVATARARVYV